MIRGFVNGAFAVCAGATLFASDAFGCRATYYGSESGTRTATGEHFDIHARTVAHPYLPLNSFVKVTNLGNGRAAILRVNDRGPSAWTGNCIDLSVGSAAAIGMRGTANVSIQPLSGAYFDHNRFRTLSSRHNHARGRKHAGHHRR